GPAVQANIRVRDIDVAPDGGVYIADPGGGGGSVRYVSPDGIISTLIGTGVGGQVIVEQPAKGQQIWQAQSVALGRDGTLFVAVSNSSSQAGGVIYSVASDGIVRHEAGCLSLAGCYTGTGLGRDARQVRI